MMNFIMNVFVRRDEAATEEGYFCDLPFAIKLREIYRKWRREDEGMDGLIVA